MEAGVTRRIGRKMVLVVALALMVPMMAVACTSAAAPRASAPHGAASALGGDARDDAESPGPSELKDGRPATAAQVAQAQQQAAAIPVGDPQAWQFVGPTNIGGRVVDLATDPTTS